MPDKYEDNLGNEYSFPPDKKEDMKDFALYFTFVFGVFTVSVQYYFYRIVKKWADKDTIIQHAKVQRLS